MSCNPHKAGPAYGNTRRTLQMQMFYNDLKERERLIAESRPEDLCCHSCGRLFAPSWDHLEGQWGYPEITDSGICRQCRKLQHIRQNMETCLKHAGVPPKYLHCSFENFQVMDENRMCVNACGHYLSHPRPDFPGLYLYENCGTGKTHLAAAIVRKLLLKGKQVVFTCVPRLCFEIKKAFHNNCKVTEQDAIQAYVSCEYLVLDDLGVEKPTEWVKKTLGYIIYERDNMFKPTIITSNLSLDEMSHQVDHRIASRIAGMGPVVRVQGPDWRLKQYLS